MAASTTGNGMQRPSSAQNPSQGGQSIAELFESMSYGPAPEADNVAQVRQTTGLEIEKS